MNFEVMLAVITFEESPLGLHRVALGHGLEGQTVELYLLAIIGFL
jgi:hypothetical protein